MMHLNTNTSRQAGAPKSANIHAGNTITGVWSSGVWECDEDDATFEPVEVLEMNWAVVKQSIGVNNYNIILRDAVSLQIHFNEAF